MRDSRRGAEITVQSMPNVLERIVYCTCGHLMEDDTTENKKPHGKSTSKKVSKETLRKHSRSIYP